MRHPFRILATLFCLVNLLAFAPSAFAQAPPVYAGSTTTVSAVKHSAGGTDPNDVGTWWINGPNGLRIDSSAPGGWNVSPSGQQLAITAPATGPYGSYTAFYVTSTHFYTSPEPGGYTDNGFQSTFNVVPAPPAKPVAAPGPAFSWQGSVAGVNTGNGNKLTSVPLVGWTMRGGMPVSCALYHNSQGATYGGYGYKWLLSYYSYITTDGNGNPTIHWDNGLSYAFTKNGTAFISPYGILDTLTGSSGSGYTLTTPEQTKSVFGFSASGNWYLSSITDLDGNTLTINHRSDSLISSVVDPSGRSLTYAYDGSARLSTVTDPLSRQWVMNYGSGSYLASIQLPPVSGQTYSIFFGYGDGQQNITAIQNPRGFTSNFGYNLTDNSLAWAQDNLSNRTTFTYNPVNNNQATTVITDPNSHNLTHTYAASRLVSVTDALGKTESYGYDYNNILSSKTDKLGNLWSYSSHFSNRDNVSTSTDALSSPNVTTSTYDPTQANKLVSSTDAVGNTTAYTYSTDGHFDLLSATVTGTGSSPFTATTQTGGYANGLPTTFTDALSHQSSVIYDGYGNVTSAKDANGNTTSATYNALGWKLTGKDALSHTTTYTYDNWGRVTDVQARTTRTRP